jgi:hypothetical protein
LNVYDYSNNLAKIDEMDILLSLDRYCYQFGHEICFVGDEAFRKLSKVDPAADGALQKKITEDKSDEWFAKHGGKKEEKA